MSTKNMIPSVRKLIRTLRETDEANKRDDEVLDDDNNWCTCGAIHDQEEIEWTCKSCGKEVG
jgi:hypothetical protein